MSRASPPDPKRTAEDEADELLEDAQNQSYIESIVDHEAIAEETINAAFNHSECWAIVRQALINALEGKNE